MDYKLSTKKTGFTFAELMIYVVIMGIIGLFFSMFLTTAVKGTKKSEYETVSFTKLRTIITEIERDIFEANEFIFVSSMSVEFVVDIVKNPNFNLLSDNDNDGVLNRHDSDVDNDAPTRFFLPYDEQWKVGYNLEDDDEDNDGCIDVKIKIYFDSGKKEIYRGISINEGLYEYKKIAKVTKVNFTYYGSKREELGKNIDLGNDGIANTGDAGENDGIISSREIDWVVSPAGHGNRSGVIDTPEELQYIALVGIYLEMDENNDNVIDANLYTEIMPPLVQLKRRR